MSRAPIFVRVHRGHLVPNDSYAAQQIDELGEGKEFNARLSRITATGREERAGMRGLWFAGLDLLSKNTEDPDYDSPGKAYDNIRIALGWCRPRLHIQQNKIMRPEPLSTSDEAMTDEEFAILQEKARAFCELRFGFDPFAAWVAEQDAMKANQQGRP